MLTFAIHTHNRFMAQEEVILVNGQDEQTGVMEKLEAHRRALLHRAFSVFIFNDKGQMLLQQRALNKYHSPGLWTNACCSHPRPGEDTLAAAHRRLREEMGLDAELNSLGSFIYRAEFGNGLTEHEFDHVFSGKTERQPVINPDEVNDYSWQDTDQIKARMASHPEEFTVWFRIAMERWF